MLVEDDLVPARIGERPRRRRHAVDAEGVHLQLGKGAPHAVAIDHRKTRLRGDDHGAHRVGAADLAGNDMGKAPSHVALQRPHGAHALIAAADPLDADRRRAHAADRGHEGIIANLIERDDLDGPARFELLQCLDLAEVRVPATAGAQNACADRERVEHLRRHVPHCCV